MCRFESCPGHQKKLDPERDLAKHSGSCCFSTEVVELVDTHVSGACVARHEGSSPSFGTVKTNGSLSCHFFCWLVKMRYGPKALIALCSLWAKAGTYGLDPFLQLKLEAINDILVVGGCWTNINQGLRSIAIGFSQWI